jgi:hypothetical protein
VADAKVDEDCPPRAVTYTEAELVSLNIAYIIYSCVRFHPDPD